MGLPSSRYIRAGIIAQRRSQKGQGKRPFSHLSSQADFVE